jgi:hypothetical protein
MYKLKEVINGGRHQVKFGPIARAMCVEECSSKVLRKWNKWNVGSRKNVQIQRSTNKQL